MRNVNDLVNELQWTLAFRWTWKLLDGCTCQGERRNALSRTCFSVIGCILMWIWYLVNLTSFNELKKFMRTSWSRNCITLEERLISGFVEKKFPPLNVLILGIPIFWFKLFQYTILKRHFQHLVSIFKQEHL